MIGRVRLSMKEGRRRGATMLLGRATWAGRPKRMGGGEGVEGEVGCVCWAGERAGPSRKEGEGKRGEKGVHRIHFLFPNSQKMELLMYC